MPRSTNVFLKRMFQDLSAISVHVTKPLQKSAMTMSSQVISWPEPSLAPQATNGIVGEKKQNNTLKVTATAKNPI